MKHFLKDIITQAGKLTLDYRRRLPELVVQNKSVRELVTEADKAVEKFLTAEILKRYPDHGILGEEQGERLGREYRWLIDPIDGTTCFVHGQPFFGISIGIEKSGQMVLGAVNFPVLGEMYEAAQGDGAKCNGTNIRVSNRQELGQSVLATSLGCIGTTVVDDNVEFFRGINTRIKSLRILGSAALHLCYVANGLLEGYWQGDVKPWDVAAGMLILSEAGGKYTDFSGAPYDLSAGIVATNGLIHHKLIQLLSAVSKRT